jgi:hypothetical protein
MIRDGVLQGEWHIPSLAHLRAYGCKAYVQLTANKLKARKNHYKMHARAEIGYLIGYQSTNIYKIWIPATNEVRSSRDVLFDEESFFDGKTPEPLEPLAMRELREVIDLTMDPTNETFEDIWQLPAWAQENAMLEGGEERPPRNDEDLYSRLVDFRIEGDSADSETDLEGAPSVFSTQSFPIDGSETDSSIVYHVDNTDTPNPLDAFGFTSGNAVRGAFYAGRTVSKQKAVDRAAQDGLRIINLPPPPKRPSDLRGHMFEKEFKQAERDHLESHETSNSWEIVPKAEARKLGCRILDSMWVYVYKELEDGTLKKCKARLVVRGDQEPKTAEDTYAPTLAARTFRILMALAAKYDLEVIQLDVVNAFMNAKLDRPVFMNIPAGYREEGETRCYRLKRAMYGLRKSPLLWQKELTAAFESLGFQQVPQEPCLIIRDDIIIFYFVDDVGMMFPRQRRGMIDEILSQLRSKYNITGGDTLDWFLGIHVTRDRAARKLWLSQATYCDKVFAKYADEAQAGCSNLRVTTPLPEHVDLRQHVGITGQRDREQFQQRVGAAQYAASITRPDIAFATARLARHSYNPSPEARAQVNHLINYLKNTRNWAIEYDGLNNESGWEIYSDASHADDRDDRKSSQGYVFKICGGPVSWKASKQASVTTSSTEAELLALSETARETLFLARILRALDTAFEKPPVIKCDNQMTMRLLQDQTAVLNTRLRHVDIHTHWLRQEVQRGHIQLEYVKTAENAADGFTKALGRQRFEKFRTLLGMVEHVAVVSSYEEVS